MFRSLHGMIAEKSTSPNKNSMFYREGWIDFFGHQKLTEAGMAELSETELKMYLEGYEDAAKHAETEGKA
jgi:hypothetical protein